MNSRILAALLAAAALPVAAQVSAPAAEPAPAAPQAKSAKARPEGVTPRDRARLAKAQAQQAKRTPRAKRDPSRKPSAT